MAFDDLKREQQLAIELLVLGDPDLPGKSLKYKEIAERCDVAEFTLRRWRHDPEFEAAKQEFREKVAKSTLFDEAIQTVRRSMRSKDSTHAAELVFKWMGALKEVREVSGNINQTQQIDIRSSDTQQLLKKIQEYHKAMGLPENVHLYLGQGEVVDGEIVNDKPDEKDTDEDD